MTMDELFAVKLAGHDSRFSLTSDARDRLARYLDDARSALADDADRDEIVADLETAIGDRLACRRID